MPAHCKKCKKNKEAIKLFKNTEIKMKNEDRVLGSVIGYENECKTLLETQLEQHNKILKNLARSQKHHHRTCNSVTPNGTRKIIIFSRSYAQYHRKFASLREDTAGTSHSKIIG